MSDWNQNSYDLSRKPNLKTGLICISITIILIIGFTFTERIVFNLTFPPWEEQIEIHGIGIKLENSVAWVDGSFIVGHGFGCKISIRLVVNSSWASYSGLGIQYTRIWVIPQSEQVWSWRHYVISSVMFYEMRVNSSTECSFIYHNNQTITMKYGLREADIILEGVTSSGLNFYLHESAIQFHYLF